MLDDEEFEKIAMKSYRDATKSDAPDAWSLFGSLMAVAAMYTPDPNEADELARDADEALARALELDETHWDATLTRGVMYIESSDDALIEIGTKWLERLLAEQRRSSEKPSKFANTYLYLGDAYKKQGRDEDAEATWRQGAEMHPSHAELRRRSAAEG